VNNTFINFSPPAIGEDEINEVVDSLRSGWITTGPKVKEFENKICEYTGAKFAVATFSCTDALFLSLKCLGIDNEDEVIVPTFTFASTAHVVAHCGAKPVFVDSDPETFQMNTELIEEKINSNTKAIIPVHYGGNPVDMDKVFAIADKYNLRVIEDAAHAIGAEYKGKEIGSLESNACCFSFYATKNLCTAEGGMILTNDERMANRTRKLTMYGISDSREIWDKRYSKHGHWFYDIEEIGYKANMTDLNAALGLHQLKKIDYFNEIRSKYTEKYIKGLEKTGCSFMKVQPLNKSACHLFPLILPEKIDRDDFIEKLRAAKIGTSVLFRPLHLQSAYKKLLGTKYGDFPVSEKIFNHLVNLPVSPKCTEYEIDYIIDSIRNILSL
jgi:dTDP-4-amino-4,6-dideoxygalactose transaminase